MKIFNTQKNKAFTLIETMVAVLILTTALVSLLSVNASSIFSARYAKNEIIANYLLQEVIDYIRNDRDTIVFLQNSANTLAGWNAFQTKYANCLVSNFSSGGVGCYFEAGQTRPITITTCGASTSGFGSLTCPLLQYDDSASHNDFYTYQTTDLSGKTLPISNFKRQILMQVNPANGGNEIDVKATVEWLNGNLVRSRSLQISFLKWQ